MGDPYKNNHPPIDKDEKLRLRGIPAANQKPDRFEEAARKAVELTNLCKLHMEYHGQQTPECTPEERVLITPKLDTTLREEIKEWVRIMFGDRPESKDNDILDHYTDAILDAVAKRLPEEKDPKGDEYWEGFNRATSEVRAIIEGK